MDGLWNHPLNAAYNRCLNGARPEFPYGIIEAAVGAIGITDRRRIDASFGPDRPRILGEVPI